MILVMYHAEHNKLGLYLNGYLQGQFGYWCFVFIEDALGVGWQVIGEL